MFRSNLFICCYVSRIFVYPLFYVCSFSRVSSAFTHVWPPYLSISATIHAHFSTYKFPHHTFHTHIHTHTHTHSHHTSQNYSFLAYQIVYPCIYPTASLLLRPAMDSAQRISILERDTTVPLWGSPNRLASEYQ
jgi:hypothetical protein